MARREVLIMVAPNGARRGKADHPALPVTPQELAEEAAACARAGAAALHLHVRDEGGGHTLDPACYRTALREVRARVGQGMVVQVTTEAAGLYGPDEQMAVVRELRPEAVSMALRELVPDDSAPTLERAATFFRWAKDAGIAPQYILYSPAEVARFARLHVAGVVPQRRPFLLFVLGSYHGEAADAAMLDACLKAAGDLPIHWMSCAFGPAEAEIALRAAARGGHVRVGFENNLLLPDGRIARDNAELVATTAGLLAAEGFTPMNAEAAAALMRDAAA